MSGIRTRLSIMMFLQYAVWGAWTTALGAHLLHTLEFTGKQTGAIYGCLWLACIIAPFIGGQLADRFMPTQIFLAIAHLLGAVLLVVTAFQTRFQGMWIWMFLYSLCYAPTLALTNSICFRNLENVERDFGRIRMWGTIGWIVAGILITGIRLQWKTELWTTKSDLLLYAAFFSLLLGLFCFALPHTPPNKKSENPYAFLDAIGMLKDSNFLVFILVAFVVTTELQFYYVSTAPFLEDQNLPAAWLTAVKTVAQMAEILVLLFFLHVSLKKYGVRKTMIIGILAWPLRYLLFTIPSLPVIIAALTLHGFGYAFFFVASQIYVDAKAGPDMRASAQALLTFFTLGVGNFLGTMFTGWCMDYFQTAEGMQWTKFFMVPTVICIVMAFIFMILFRDEVAGSAGEPAKT
jgi:nucleoside transporter